MLSALISLEILFLSKYARIQRGYKELVMGHAGFQSLSVLFETPNALIVDKATGRIEL